ncbi:hypothetical protein [Treponema denticola]|uniref:hypothetical protein n=1 Tax=Treponema denticola TaxID=158 RepID=UPI0021068810|nr:hypothetical protein [Treponema denticola]UTY23142.1 hypothetical protein E4N78_02540 [Treponema denticola]
MKKKNNVLLFTLLICTVMTVFTCKQNIGLGASVNVAPPTGEIIYPDAGETPIRGRFVMKGTASDENGIQSVSIVFQNIETNEKTKAFEAVLSDSGTNSVTWTADINNESTGTEDGHPLVKLYPIPDGEYTAVVTVTDKGGVPSIFTKNYKIDNTPPVFIVSRPSMTVDAADMATPQADGYGAIFSVVGQAGERNTVEKLNVHVPGATPIDITNMFVGKNINAQVAVYSAAPPLNPLYDLQEQDKTKPIRGQLYLYDNAREYKGGDASGEGNKADWYYLWKEVYTEVIAKGYTPEVLSDYFAGKKGSDANEHDKKIKELRSDTVALVKLKSAMIKMSDMRSTFKLDPSKSPGFKVIGSKHLSTTPDQIKTETPANASAALGQASAIMYKDGGEASFLVELIPNKDNIPLVGGSNAAAYNASKIKIVLYKWKPADNAFDTANPITLVDFDSFTDAYLSSHPDLIKTEGDKLRIQCTFPSAQGEGIYAVDVQGRDTSNEESNEFKAYDNSDTASGMYALKFYSAGSGPRTRPISLEGFKKANAKFIIAAEVTGIDAANGHVYCNIGTSVNDSDIELKKATAAATNPRYEVEVEIVKVSGKYVIKWKDPAGLSKQKELPDGFSDGTHKIKFLSKAGPGLTDTDETDFVFDTKAPEIKEIFSPDLSKNQSGDFTMRGSVIDTPSGVKSIKYIVGKQDADITVQPAESAAEWKNIVLSGENWSIDFTGSNNITKKTTAESLGKKVGSDELYDIPIFFLVEDKAAAKDTHGGAQKGNTAIITKVLRVDPNGDIPIVTVSTPDAGQVLGGTIRISGFVNVPDPSAGQVGSMWIQITDKKDGLGNPDFTQNATFGSVNWCPNPDGKQLSSTGTNPEYKAGGSYWSVEINANKEFEPSSGTQRDIWFRLRGKNNKTTPVAGQWTAPVKITVDKAAPTITGMKVATEAKIGTAIPSSVDPENQTYVSNMWIKGDALYLCADLAHNAGIEQIDISGSYFGASTITLKDDSQITDSNINGSGKAWFTQSSVPSTTTAKNYKMRIPLKTTTKPGRNNGFTITIKIKAKKQGDTEGLQSSTTFSFKYDNTAPTAVFGTKIASSGTVTVSGTSFSDLALVGKTNIDTTMRFFASGQDIKITAFDKDTGTVTLASAPANPTTGYLIYSPIEYLRPDASGKVSVVGAAYDVGSGVEKIKVNYNGVSSTEIELESPSGVLTDVGNGDVNFVTWKGVIDVSPTSIVDGKGKIVITPIDRAHNTPTPIEADVKLKKNLLKITGVELGTDINRNGSIANVAPTVETKTLALTYDADKPNGIDSKKYDWHGKADGGTFRFKNNKSQIKITAEDVGATAKKYTLKRKKISDSLPEVEVHNLSSLPSSGIIELAQTDFDKIKQSDNPESSNPIKRTLVLTVWNSAAGLTCGTNTWKAELEFDVIVDTKDRIAPTNEIDPFKWVSETDNSLYGNSKANGHIEIGTDLPSAFNQPNGLMDKDDKVSGKISITGTAYDDQVITEIWAKIDAFTFTGANTTDPQLGHRLATYNASNGNFTVESGNFDTDGWKFAIVSNDFSVEDGHTVKWQLDWDSSKITDGVGTDKTITVTVKDTAQTNTKSDSRKVDVVPYITEIETSIKTLLGEDFMRTATGAYTVRAKTSASEYENVTVTGFNLQPTTISGTGSDIRLSNSKTGCEIATDGTVTKKGKGLTATQVTAGDNSKWNVTIESDGNGYLTFIVNGVPSINNIDNNSAEYNKEASLIQANADNDRKIELWDFTQLWKNSAAPKAQNAVYPSMVMKENTPQFAYVNNAGGYGLAEFWDGSAEIKIYSNWDLFTFSALALNSDNSRAALFDINVALRGTGNAPDTGGIMTNFFYKPPNTTSNGTSYFFRNYNVWMDGLYKSGVTAVLDRYQYPCIKMVGTDSLSHVFYSTYDALDDRIIFRYFKVGTNATLVGNNNNANAHKVHKDTETLNLYINKNELNQVTYNSTNWPSYNDNNNDNRRFNATGNYSGTTIQPQEFATGTGNGVYSAAAGVPVTTTDNIVNTARGILVYYSGTSLNYIYAKNDENTSWSTPIELDTNCGGDYVSMVVDKDKHVHIAYQDSFGGDVKYIYIPEYSNPANRKMVKVDSYLAVGGKLTLTVHGNTPYIAYKGLGTVAKVAWYKANNGVPAVDSLASGVNDNDKFTGAWESQIIPTRIVDSDSNRFNIGVGTDGRPVIGYSNNQSGSKGIEYLTRMPDLTD